MTVATLKRWDGVCGRCRRVRRAAATEEVSRVLPGGGAPATSAPKADEASWGEADIALPKVLFLLCAEYALPSDAHGLTAMFVQISSDSVNWVIRAIGDAQLAAFGSSIARGSVMSGDQAVMERVAELAPDLLDQTVKENTQRVFCTLCAGGRLSALRWLYARSADLDIFRDYSVKGMGYACEYGHLETAKWVAARYGIGAGSFGKKKTVYALRRACANGHISVVDWFLEAFQLSSAALVVATIAAADEGHYGLAQSLMHKAGAFGDEKLFDKVMSDVDPARGDFSLLCRPLLVPKASAASQSRV
jgi:hypothetical protein